MVWERREGEGERRGLGFGNKKEKEKGGKKQFNEFFSETRRLRKEESVTCRKKARYARPYSARPARSSNDDATAFAAAQPNMAPQRSLHACSARLLINGTSSRARALANCLKNARVSLDHWPPTSTAGTGPLAKSCAASNTRDNVSWSSRQTRSISFVHPPGPEVTPDGEPRKQSWKIFLSKFKGRSGWNSVTVRGNSLSCSC